MILSVDNLDAHLARQGGALWSVLATAALAAVIVLTAGCPAPPERGGNPSGSSASNASASKGGGAKVPVSLAKQASPGSQEVLAKIGGAELTVGDVQARLDKQSPFVRARYQSTEKRKEFLDNQVRFELLALEAAKRGLHEDPDVQETIKKVMVQKLTRLDFEGKVKLSDVTDAEMQKYYEDNTAEYNKPEMVRVSMLKIAFGADKEAARKKVEQGQKSAAVPDRLEDRAHFRRLVTDFSTDEESKKTGGDLRYKSEAELTEMFGADIASQIWKLPAINSVTGVVEGKDAFYVFKKTGKRKPITRSFDQVKNQIRNLIYRDKRTQAFDDFVAKLKTQFKVETFDDKLELLEIKAGPAGAGDGTLIPPPGPGGMPSGHPGSGH